jgi:hypothetical protein
MANSPNAIPITDLAARCAGTVRFGHGPMRRIVPFATTPTARPAHPVTHAAALAGRASGTRSGTTILEEVRMVPGAV